jgi:hypothetical protein
MIFFFGFIIIYYRKIFIFFFLFNLITNPIGTLFKEDPYYQLKHYIEKIVKCKLIFFTFNILNTFNFIQITYKMGNKVLIPFEKEKFIDFGFTSFVPTKGCYYSELPIGWTEVTLLRGINDVFHTYYCDQNGTPRVFVVVNRGASFTCIGHIYTEKEGKKIKEKLKRELQNSEQKYKLFQKRSNVWSKEFPFVLFCEKDTEVYDKRYPELKLGKKISSIQGFWSTEELASQAMLLTEMEYGDIRYYEEYQDDPTETFKNYGFKVVDYSIDGCWDEPLVWIGLSQKL